MQIFLDTADIHFIQEAIKTGLITGITTNPTSLSKEIGKEHSDIIKLLKKICELLDPYDVSIEVTESEPKAVYAQAKRIAQIAPNVAVKIPCKREYLEVIKQLVAENIAVNITLLFSFVQGMLMCKLGVKYISPFIGRLDDIDSNGLELIEDLKTGIDNYDFETQILAASIHNLKHIHHAALLGADIATIPTELFDKLLEHPLTNTGLAQFQADWKKLGITQFP